MILLRIAATRCMNRLILQLIRTSRARATSLRSLINTRSKCVSRWLQTRAVRSMLFHSLKRRTVGTTTKIMILSVYAGVWVLECAFSFQCLECSVSITELELIVPYQDNLA